MLRAHRDMEFSETRILHTSYFLSDLSPLLLLYHLLFNSVQVNRYTNCETEQWFLLDRWYFTRSVVHLCGCARDQRAKSLISSGNHILCDVELSVIEIQDSWRYGLTRHWLEKYLEWYKHAHVTFNRNSEHRTIKLTLRNALKSLQFIWIVRTN